MEQPDQNPKTPQHKTVTVNNSESGYEFYADGDMRNMLTAEQILNTCSDSDRLIIMSLISGMTIEETAGHCFLTEGGVKYRIKRILNECKLSDKSELLTLLKDYLNPIIPKTPEL